jgi:hypothetical protein
MLLGELARLSSLFPGMQGCTSPAAVAPADDATTRRSPRPAPNPPRARTVTHTRPSATAIARGPVRDDDRYDDRSGSFPAERPHQWQGLADPGPQRFTDRPVERNLERSTSSARSTNLTFGSEDGPWASLSVIAVRGRARRDGTRSRRGRGREPAPRGGEHAPFPGRVEPAPSRHCARIARSARAARPVGPSPVDLRLAPKEVGLCRR